ncbi:hypothetical protein ACFWTE_08275 [Nocardiopsis sp. NPDC058631]|uniref:hypothetical protein n=1 Tax=Nocardiopsis sp. NPDC058631 TaxID=3346566 RepID=UPI0036572C9A
MTVIYLAGKVAANDWRHDTVEGLRGAWPTNTVSGPDVITGNIAHGLEQILILRDPDPNRRVGLARDVLSPPGFDHINFLGSHTFPTDPTVEGLRPLRDPRG